MEIHTIQELFEQLIKATTPDQIKEILSEIGDWPDVGLNRTFGKLNLFWHPYGDDTSNRSSIGLATNPGRSITERITNAIDAVLEEHALRTSIKPSSPQAAVNQWFGRHHSTSESGLFNWKYSQGNYDRKVGVILNDSQKQGAPTIDILDLGVGIAPDNFPNTILSLHGGNKITKKYLVGAFGQGGASTLAYCDYVFIVSRHVQNPNVVSFTVIKEINLGDEYKENCYAYLAFKTTDGKLRVPSFSLESPIKIYNSQHTLRLNELQHGTLVRHYAFRLSNLSKPLSPSEGNLYHFLHFSLFDPLIPFQIIDLRNPERPKQEISTGSRNRLMKLMNKGENEIDDSNSEYKLYRPFAFITPHGAILPCIKIEYWVVFNYEKKTRKKTGEEYRDLRSDSNALFIQRKHPAVITLNGQNQGQLTTSQATKDLGLDLISRHLIIHIDATEAPKDIRSKLFSTNRESLKEDDVLESIKEELRRILKDDTDLAQLEKHLEEREISQVTESTDDEVKKEIVKLLRESGFIPSAEGDTIRKGNGDNNDDVYPPPPGPPPPPPPPPVPLETLPYPQVTKFEIVSPKDLAKIHHNRTVTILVETDADSKFKNEIRIKIEPNSLEQVSYFPLNGGRVKWRLKPSEASKVGDKGKIQISLTKPNGDQLKGEIDYEILERVEKPVVEQKGFVPDFEVLPITPGDEKWSKAWENIPEESDDVFSVAYIPKKIGNDKTVVYYSTVFTAFKEVIDKLKITNSPLLKSFETNYKIWIGYHGLLQQKSQLNENIDGEEQEERDKQRALVAQMQVKQAAKSAELMYKFSKQQVATM